MNTRVTLPVVVALLTASQALAELPSQPIALHPDNPHYFLWRGKPTILITSGEHYGAVLNLDFNYVKYLDELQANGLNLTRTFSGVYREIPSSFGITDNPLAPKANRYVCPWARSDTAGYFDGGNKFDLTQWDPAYFRRLRDFMSQAQRRGVVVELNLFCPMYREELWKASPMNAANNVNGVGRCPRNEVYNLKHADLLDVQLAVTRKIVNELREFDNLYYEVCNEPYFGGVTMDWQHKIVETIVETEREFPARHLISRNVANGRQKVEHPHSAVSIFNFHYCVPPDTVAMNFGLNKVIGENETGFRGKNDVLYRTEGWDFLLAGGGLYNNLDYSFTPQHPDGSFLDYKSPGGGSPALRKQLRILKDFLYGFDFVHMRPDDSVIRKVSPELSARALVNPGRAYAVYLHVPLPRKPKNLKEHLRDDLQARLTLDLPAGTYTAEWVNTKTGRVEKSETVTHTGGPHTLQSPPFANDVALKIGASVSDAPDGHRPQGGPDLGPGGALRDATARAPHSALLALNSQRSTFNNPEPYDVLITNGRIVDGTGNPWYEGDLAVRGDRIVAVGRVPEAPAKLRIDANGLVVAPGFIDMHSHSDFLLLEDGDAQSKIRQGVTTEVLGEGNSAGPYQGKLAPPHVVIDGDKTSWTTLGGYFEAVERAGISTNVCSYVGLSNVWQCAMGGSFERPGPAEIEQMKRLVDEAMQEGAMGLSSQVMMPPGSLATTDDIAKLCKVVAPYGGIYSTHIRNEGTGVFDSVKEAIEIGERAGVPVDVIHLKIADQQYWGRMNEVVALFEAARKRGVNVQANVYPYTRGNNNLVSIIPPWAHEGGRQMLLKRLSDPKLRERMKRDIKHGLPGWYNHYTAVGGDWSRMLISADNPFKGLTMDRVMAIRTKGKDNPDLLDELFDFLLENGGSVSTVYAHHTEKDMTLALKQPWCSIGSDGSAYAIEGKLRRGNPHPRNFGTFPRVLGVYVRERGLLRVEDAVRKMTSLSANKIGLQDRGLLKPGLFADVTIFNPQTVIDKATYTEPFQYPEGIEYVLVNGQLVLDRDRHTGARPGRALRRTP